VIERRPGPRDVAIEIDVDQNIAQYSDGGSCVTVEVVLIDYDLTKSYPVPIRKRYGIVVKEIEWRDSVPLRLKRLIYLGQRNRSNRVACQVHFFYQGALLKEEMAIG
jgi:hypothetical protein